MPVMIVVALSCLPVFFIGNQIARWRVLCFWLLRGIYCLSVLRASHHDALPRFNAIMLVFCHSADGHHSDRADTAHGATEPFCTRTCLTKNKPYLPKGLRSVRL